MAIGLSLGEVSLVSNSIQILSENIDRVRPNKDINWWSKQTTELQLEVLEQCLKQYHQKIKEEKVEPATYKATNRGFPAFRKVSNNIRR